MEGKMSFKQHHFYFGTAFKPENESNRTSK